MTEPTLRRENVVEHGNTHFAFPSAQFVGCIFQVLHGKKKKNVFGNVRRYLAGFTEVAAKIKAKTADK